MTHTVEWTIEDNGVIRAKFTCESPKGATCRVHCTNGCEEWINDSGQCEICEVGQIVDSGECQAMFWLESSEPEEVYGGSTHPLTSGPIELDYTERVGYTWRYS